jgi:hypothetical protein
MQKGSAIYDLWGVVSRLRATGASLLFVLGTTAEASIEQSVPEAKIQITSRPDL